MLRSLALLAFAVRLCAAQGSTCAAPPPVTIGDNCAETIERATPPGVCEWTGACGTIEGTDCANKCIGSIEVLSSVARVVNGAIVNNGLLYCHLLATTIARTYQLVQEDTIADGGGDGPAAAPAAALPPGCPSDEVIETVANSPLFAIVTQADLPTTAASDVGEGGGLFGFLRTAPALQAFFSAACETAVVEPPLSSLYPPATDYTPTGNSTDPPTCYGEAPVAQRGPVTVCRDRFGLLEAAFQGSPALTSAETRNELVTGTVNLLRQTCTAARDPGNSPNGVCSPNAYLLDAECLQRMVPLLGLKLTDTLTTQAAQLMSRGFQELHARCGEATTKQECLASNYPEVQQRVVAAAGRVFEAALPTPEPTTTRRAGEAPTAGVPTPSGNGTVAIDAPANATTSDTDTSREITAESGPAGAPGAAAEGPARIAEGGGSGAGGLAAPAALGSVVVLLAAALLA